MNNLELPQEGGKYILTKEVIEKIKLANSICVSFYTRNGQPVEEKCWWRIWIKGKIAEVEVEVGFQMPVNITSYKNQQADWEFLALEYTAVSYETRHAMLGLMKPGAAICFRPCPDMHTTGLLMKNGLVHDKLFWQVEIGPLTYEGIFSEHISTPNCPHRLIKKTNF